MHSSAQNKNLINLMYVSMPIKLKFERTNTTVFEWSV